MSKLASIRRWSPALAALAVFLVAGSADAQDPRPRYTAEGKLRVHIDTSLFGWTQIRPWYDAPGSLNPPPMTNPRERLNIIGFGAMRPLMIDQQYANFGGLGGIVNGSSQFALGVGYGVHRHVLIGARLGLAFDRLRSRDEASDMMPDLYTSNRLFGAVFTPYIEVLPIPEGRVLPYIQFRTGFAGTAYGTRTHGGPAGDSLARTSTISPIVGVGAGAHFFLIPQVSLDLGLHFDYRWNFSRGVQKDITSGAVVKSDWTHDTQAFQLALNFGLSAWFF